MSIELLFRPAVYTQFFGGDQRKGRITLTDAPNAGSCFSLNIDPGNTETEQFFKEVFDRKQNIVATFSLVAVPDPAAASVEPETTEAATEPSAVSESDSPSESSVVRTTTDVESAG